MDGRGGHLMVMVVVVIFVHLMVMMVVVMVVVVVAPALEDGAPRNYFRKMLLGALSSNEGLDSPVQCRMQT